MVVAGLTAGVAQLTMTRAYAHDRAARVSAFGYLNVIASALLGALSSGIWPSLLSGFGMLCVVAGGFILLLAQEPAPPRSRTHARLSESQSDSQERAKQPDMR
jgi:drug/metabolite transporter (DMT)-like permease